MSRWLLCFVLLAAPALASAAGFFEREQPEVAAGNAAMARGDFEEALSFYDRAASEVGDRPEVHHNRGSALYQLGRWDEARAAWVEALALRRDEAGAARDYAHIGNVAAQQGALDEAIDAYRRSLSIDPGAGEVRRNLERVLQRKRQQEEQQDPAAQDEPQDDGESESEREPGEGDSSEPEAPRGGEGEQDEEREPESGEGESGEEQEPESGGGESGEEQEPESREGEPDETQAPPPGDSGESGNEEQAPQPGEADAPQEQQPGDGNEPEGARQPGDLAPAGGATPAEEAPGGRSDAVRLLDALRDSEKNFQLWHFQKQPTKKGSSDGQKDW